jgi:hypothetical protein
MFITWWSARPVAAGTLARSTSPAALSPRADSSCRRPPVTAASRR